MNLLQNLDALADAEPTDVAHHLIARDAAQEIRHLRLTLVRIIGGVAHATWPGRAEQLAASALGLSESHGEAAQQIEKIKIECENPRH